MGSIILISLAIGVILGGILVLRKSARKFDLTPEQLIKIQQRNTQLTKEDRDEHY